MKKFDKTWMLARGWYTSGRMVEWTCPQCKATGFTIADKCDAPLEKPCPGFIRTEQLYQEFEQNWKALAGQ